MLATSSKTRGGITAVINAYQNTNIWEKWNCIWIETHIDRGFFYKIFYFVRALIQFLFLLPTSSLIHCHLSGPVSTFRKLPFLFLAKLFRKPFIVHFHAGIPDSNFERINKSIYSLIFEWADVVIVLSQSWKSRICKELRISETKVKIILNPCPKRDEALGGQKEKIIMFAGTLKKGKGYQDLIHAFAKIDNKLDDWKLVFAGNGELSEAKKMVEDFGLEDRVVFLGWVSGKDKRDAFSRASIFCLPSYAEGFPMAILDAWSYGIPVIATPVGGIPDVAIHKENMMLFKAGDVFSLQNIMEELITNENLQLKLSAASFEFSNNIFSVEKLSKEWNEIYEDLTKR